MQAGRCDNIASIAPQIEPWPEGADGILERHTGMGKEIVHPATACELLDGLREWVVPCAQRLQARIAPGIAVNVEDHEARDAARPPVCWRHQSRRCACGPRARARTSWSRATLSSRA